MRILPLILVLIASAASAQLHTIQGIITDENKNAIPYVNIGFENTSIGTVSNTKGGYSLTFDLSEIEDNNLVFSCVGFQKSTFTFNEIIHQKSLPVLLQKKTVNLREVIVRPTNQKIKVRGNTSEESLIKVNLAIANKTNMNLGAGIGKRFNLGSKEHFIQSLGFYIAGNNFDSLTFQVDFYDIKWGKPKILLNDTQIVVQVNQHSKGWVVVDLQAYNLALKGNIAACVSWIGAGSSGNALFMNMNIPMPGATHFYRFGAQNKWKRYDAMSSSMYIETIKIR